MNKSLVCNWPMVKEPKVVLKRAIKTQKYLTSPIYGISILGYSFMLLYLDFLYFICLVLVGILKYLFTY